MDSFLCFDCTSVFSHYQAQPIVRRTRDGEDDVDGYVCPFCKSESITSLEDDDDFAG